MTTRRNLLKSSLSLAAAPVGMSVAIEVAHAEDMPKWNNETDVLVLGYGNAGSNAAIAAADAGAKVLILEKTPAGGGNVSVSSGGFVVPTNKEDYSLLSKIICSWTLASTFTVNPGPRKLKVINKPLLIK